MNDTSLLHGIQESLKPEREALINHKIYRSITDISRLRIFMEHHVFAVWDFMSLLKALQRDLTCVTIPWVPEGNRLSRRLINEIVLEEESDADGPEHYISHFELYRAAMAQCGADLSRLDYFLERIRSSDGVGSALANTGVPQAAEAFVTTTMAIVKSGSTHSIAAAFTLGREDVIPEMFTPLVASLGRQFPGQLTVFRDYLERHIRLDEERHTPMALRMLAELCGEYPLKWREAETAARTALRARIALWDGVVKEIARAKCAPRPFASGLADRSYARSRSVHQTGFVPE